MSRGACSLSLAMFVYHASCLSTQCTPLIPHDTEIPTSTAPYRQQNAHHAPHAMTERDNPMNSSPDSTSTSGQIGCYTREHQQRRRCWGCCSDKIALLFGISGIAQITTATAASTRLGSPVTPTSSRDQTRYALQVYVSWLSVRLCPSGKHKRIPYDASFAPSPDFEQLFLHQNHNIKAHSFLIRLRLQPRACSCASADSQSHAMGA